MNRRDVLKNLGLSIGYAVATPSIISLLQSCKTEIDDWKPVFFSADESVIVRNLIDLILPTTSDSPGALDVNVPEFLDLYIYKTYNNKQQESYKEGLSYLLKALQVTDQGTDFLKTEDYDALLAKYLKADKTLQAKHKSHNKDTDGDNHDAMTFKALDKLRSVAVWSYKTSKEIGLNVLSYDPVPGSQKGCISVEEATGGKAWSL
ncbi:gluconate 2-dehydrogenase subunit 3 family protein [Snuella sedimenti]|uniref:Gluconate 2-dehydrogenase subunit 3 family protein n=1 Tax=Snuella sedimenti TaxID=2798802 RepID=A0A8J7IFB3_9FLAO|nr:gluconate 2-dehydrogenase subunit 3 family protein [Snuella sedimenti]MBJ6366648.1 gluconate 2-dehydrogenase subunit 3 family protein [Snuella sedimenti]